MFLVVLSKVLYCSFKGGVSTGKVVLQLSLTFVGTTLPSMSPLFWTGLFPFSFVCLFILISHILISSYSCILDPHQNKILLHLQLHRPFLGLVIVLTALSKILPPALPSCCRISLKRLFFLPKLPSLPTSPSCRRINQVQS